MSTSLDRPLDDIEYQDSLPVSRLASVVDVPGVLAGRIGELYAQEEIRRRSQRTERAIRRARALQ